MDNRTTANRLTTNINEKQRWATGRVGEDRAKAVLTGLIDNYWLCNQSRLPDHITNAMEGIVW